MKPDDLPMRARLEELEPRILYSADAAALAGLGGAVHLAHLPQAAVSTLDGASGASARDADPAAQAAARELVVIDLSLPDAQTLMAGLQAQRDAGRALDIVTLDGTTDGIAAVSRALEGRSGITALHWLSHGGEGEVRLGSVTLDSRTLVARAGEIARWSSALGERADLLIYGCDVAAGTTGAAFVQALAALTGADVAASDDATGAATLGGDWVLEAQVGSLESPLVLDAATQQAWQGLMPIAGTPFVVNTVDNKLQTLAGPARGSPNAVAYDAAGNFGVVWTSDGQDGGGMGVFVRLFDATGQARTGDVQVNEFTAGHQQYGRIAMADDGRFVVTWTSDSQDSAGKGVYARRFSADGTPQAGEFLVNTTVDKDQTNSVVAVNRSTGDFVVAWEGNGAGDSAGVFLRKYHADGSAVDATEKMPFSSLFGGIANEHNPAVAMDRSGRVTLVWDSNGDIWMQRFDAGGAQLEFPGKQVDDNGATAVGASIAVDDSGMITVVYADTGTNKGVYARGFTPAGATRVPTLQVAAGTLSSASIAAAPGGDFVVTWQVQNATADVMARVYQVDGAPVTSAFQVNAFTPGAQEFPSVAALTRDYFTIVWSGQADTANKDSISAVMYSAPPTAPVISSNGGGASAALAIPENMQAVTTVTASDANRPAQILTYAVRGTDAAAFTIDPVTGVLRFATAPNAEAPRDRGQDNVYDVDVVASDGALEGVQHLQVRVADVADTPVAVDDYASGTGGQLTVDLMANDLPGATGGAYVIDATRPAAGSASIVDGVLRYTPPGAGADRVRYLLADDAMDLQHYWRLDDWGPYGDSVIDLIHPSDPYALAVSGQTALITGEHWYATRFAGANDGVTGPDVDYGSAGFSLGLWFQVDLATLPPGEEQALYSHGTSGLANSVTVSMDGTTRQLKVLVLDGNDASATATPITFDLSGVQPSEWHHVMLTVSPTGAAQPGTSVWVDGGLVGRNSFGADGVDPSGLLQFAQGSGALADFNGALDSISLWGHALSAAEREWAFTGGSAMGTAYLTTAASAPTVTSAPDNYYLVGEDSALIAQVPSSWFDTHWAWRQKITFDNSGGSLLTDAPVLVTLDPSVVDYARFRSDGADLRFTDGDGTALPFEIESWTPGGVSRIWVKVPQIDAGSTTDFVWLYSGNPTAVSAQDPDALWGPTAAAVLHLGTDNVDASGTATGIVTVNAPVTAGAAGEAGGASSFSGTSGAITVVAPNASLQDDVFDGGGSLSVWFRADGWGEGGYGRIASKASSTYAGSTGGNGWALQVHGNPSDFTGQTGTLIFEIGFDAGTAPNVGRWQLPMGSITLGAWTHLALSYDSTSASATPSFWINGVQLTPLQTSAPTAATTSGSDYAQDLTIGNHTTGSGRAFNGAIDEFRLNVAPISSSQQVEAAYRFSRVSRVSVSAEAQRPGVMANDFASDGSALTAVLVTGPAHAAENGFSFHADGTFEYRPVADWYGEDTFTYMPNTGTVAGAVQTVKITVYPVADAPVIDSYAGQASASDGVAENSLGNLRLSAHDVDTDASLLVWSIVGGADAGHFVISADGLLQFVEAPDYEQPADANLDGIYELQLQVSDGALTDQLSLSLTVTNVFEPSVAVDDTGMTAEGVGITLDPLANDLHVDAPVLRLLDVRSPGIGSVTLSGNQVIYQPDAYASGVDSFAYRLTDGHDGLQHYWRLDGDAHDLLGGADGWISGTAAMVDGTWGGAVGFDGANSVIDLPAFSWSAGATLSFWFRRPDNLGSGIETVFSALQAGSPGWQLTVQFNGDSAPVAPGVLRTLLPGADPLTPLVLDVPAAGLCDDAWHLYAVTLDAGRAASVYIDGALMQTTAAASAGGGVTAAARVGAPMGGVAGGFFRGALDALAVHDHALAPAEVAGLYGGGASQGTISVTVVAAAPAPPEIVSDGGGDTASISRPEGTTGVTTVMAVDPNGPASPLTYTLSGPDAARFQIDAATHLLSFRDPTDYEDPSGQRSFEVSVTVTDVTGLSDVQTLYVSVSDVNEFAVDVPVDIDPLSDAVEENAALGTHVGLTASATDADGSDNVVSYSLLGAPGLPFSIDAATGIVTVSGALDAETTPSWTLTVVATATDGSSSSRDFVILIRDVNEFGVTPPQDVDPTADRIGEQAAAGSTVGLHLSAVDPDATPSIITWSIDDTADGHYFSIDGDGVVHLAASLAEIGRSSLTLVVRASSGDLSSATAAFTVTVQPSNDWSPVITSDGGGALAALSVAENTTAVTRVTATDADLPAATLSFSIVGGADSARFTIDTATGVLQFASAPDFEQPLAIAGGQTYTVVVQASDGQRATQQTLDITVTDVNEFAIGPAVDVDPAADAVDENAASGTRVGVTVNAADGDGGTNHVTYGLLGAGTLPFTIDPNSGVVTVAGAIDSETTPAYTLTVVATSADGSSSSRNVVITIRDVNEFGVTPPQDIDATADRIGEYAAVGSAVGLHLAAVDLDATPSIIAWSIDDTADGHYFSIDGDGVVRLAASLAEIGRSSLTLMVRATSSDLSVATAAFTVTVEPSNDWNPVITSDGGGAVAALSVAENTTAVTRVTATDADRPAVALSFSIGDGPDSALFTIDAATGVLQFRAAPDYESPQADADPQIRRIVVRVSDGERFATQTVEVTMTDVDEFAPVLRDADPAADRVLENAAPGAAVGLTLQAVDGDSSNPLQSLTLADDAGGRFVLDPVTGIISLARRIDDEGLATRTLVAEARFADGSVLQRSFDVTVMPVNAWDPVITSDGGAARASLSLPENRTAVTTVRATDADRPQQSLRYTIVGGADAALFGIDAVTGALQFRAAPDFEQPVAAAGGQTYAVVVQVSDGERTARQALDIQVTDVNEFDVEVPHDVLPAQPDRVMQTATPGTSVGLQLLAVDRDGSSSAVRYALVDDAAGRFAIDPQTGVVRLARSIATEAVPTYRITVRAESADGSAREAAFDIGVSFENAAPPRIESTQGAPGGPPLAVPENTTAVTTVRASDPDVPAVPLHYAIVGGADAARFEIDPDTGAIRFATAPDADIPGDANGDNVYELVWQVSDGGWQATQAIRVQVTSVDEPPLLVSNGLTVLRGGTQLDLVAQDPDTAPAQLRYSVSTSSGGWFALASSPLLPIRDFSQAQVDAGQIVYRLDGSGRTPAYVLALGDGSTQLPPAAALVRLVGGIPLIGAASAAPPAVPAATADARAAGGLAVTRTEPEVDAAEIIRHAPTAAGPAAPDERDSPGLSWQTPIVDSPPAYRLTVPAPFSSHGLPPLEGAEGTPLAAGADGRAAGSTAAAGWRPVVAVDLADASTGRRLVQVLDKMREDVGGDAREAVVAIGSTALVSGGLSVGYVLWLLRGGVLAATVVSSIPAWAGIDPLPVLSQSRRRDDDDAERDDPIERLFGRARRLMKGQEAAAPEPGPQPDNPDAPAPATRPQPSEVGA